MLLNMQMRETASDILTPRAISLSECKRLYPENNGLDGEVVYQLASQFGGLRSAEKLICMCDCDFSLAQKLGKLAKENVLVYHGNIYLLERLFTLFSKDLSAAFGFVNCFDSSITSTSSSTTTSSSITLALRFLSRFDNDVTKARKFLELFESKGAIAYSFLSRFKQPNDTTKLLGFFSDGLDANEFIERFDKTVDALSFLSLFRNKVSGAKKFLNCFDDGTSATKFLSRFNNNVSTATTFLSHFKGDSSSVLSFLKKFKYNVPEAEKKLKDPSYKIAFSGCNGDINAVEAFKDSTGIKQLELLYDSAKHPHNAEEFHSRCAGKGPTVTFVCTNKICVCGVVESPWSSQGSGKSDDSANLLRLSPQKCGILSHQAANALNSSGRPGVGPSCGIDLCFLFPKENSSRDSITGSISHKQNYNLPKGFIGKNDNDNFPVDRLVVCKYRIN